MILTVDFGTSVTKVVVWGEDGPVSMARASVTTVRPEIGWAEQEPFGWWTALIVACAEARAQAPAAFGAVEVVACSAARQTFVPMTASAVPLGRGILWSDRRATAEAAALADAQGGVVAVRELTGVPIDGESMAAKVAWLAAHEPQRLAASDWLLSPRDLVVWRLTGEVVTDTTLASRTGLYDLEGDVVPGLAGLAASRLPPVVEPGTLVGTLRAVPAAELGLPRGVPIVVGAGDRQCEVVGTGAASDRPMVSWGTTANVSRPLDARLRPVPEGTVMSRAATGGWMLEGGLSAAGSLLVWYGHLVGRDPDELIAAAGESPPGARGVVAVPWLDGARAPWWRADARAGIVGLAAVHGVADVARALVESVAWDVRRCLEAVSGDGGRSVGLTLGGSGATIPVWVSVLTSVTGLPAARRRSGEAASAGAALLAARALGRSLDLDQLDPVAEEVEPEPEAAARYAALRPVVERVASAAIELGVGEPAPGGLTRRERPATERRPAPPSTG